MAKKYKTALDNLIGYCDDGDVRDAFKGKKFNKFMYERFIVSYKPIIKYDQTKATMKFDKNPNIK